MSKLNKIATTFLSITTIGVFAPITPAFAETNQQTVQESPEDLLSPEEVNKYEGVDLLSTDFNIEQLSPTEREAFDLLVERSYHSGNIDISMEEYRQELINLFSGNSSSAFRSRGLVSTGVLGGALNVAISSALLAAGYGGIRAALSAMGKYQAEQLVRSVVIDKVRGVLFRYGFSKAAQWVTDAGVGIIIGSALDPGGAVARWIDSKDKKPNNGYIELW